MSALLFLLAPAAAWGKPPSGPSATWTTSCRLELQGALQRAPSDEPALRAATVQLDDRWRSIEVLDAHAKDLDWITVRVRERKSDNPHPWQGTREVATATDVRTYREKRTGVGHAVILVTQRTPQRSDDLIRLFEPAVDRCIQTLTSDLGGTR